MKIKFILFLLIIGIIISTTYIVKAKDGKINLNGYILFVDAGHGGKDNGASHNEVLEDNINLSINNLLVEALIDNGAYVYTSRDGDYDLADNYDKKRKAKDLKKRVELINTIKPDLFLSIHLNTYDDNSVKGGQVFYQDNVESKKFADILQLEFNKLSYKNKKAKYGDYYLLNNTKQKGVIIECGFLTNKEDFLNLQDEQYQRKIVKAIIKSIYEYSISDTKKHKSDNIV